jgi:hypothetical protein
MKAMDIEATRVAAMAQAPRRRWFSHPEVGSRITTTEDQDRESRLADGAIGA